MSPDGGHAMRRTTIAPKGAALLSTGKSVGCIRNQHCGRAAVGSVEIWPLDSNNLSLYACPAHMLIGRQLKHISASTHDAAENCMYCCNLQ
jgi:hypothetical protein